MSRLYKCPYSDSACTHEIPCMGCETFYKVQPLKIDVSNEPKPENPIVTKIAKANKACPKCGERLIHD